MKKRYIYLMVFLIIGAFIEVGKNFSKKASFLKINQEDVKFEFKAPSDEVAQFEDHRFKKILENQRKKGSHFLKNRAQKGRFSRFKRRASLKPRNLPPLKKDKSQPEELKAQNKKSKKLAKNKKKKNKTAKKKKDKNKEGAKAHVTKTKDTQDLEVAEKDEDYQNQNNNQEINEAETNINVNNNNENEKKDDRLDEWRGKLLNFANHEAMQELMSAYQRGLVSQEGFYTILYEMLDTKDSEIVSLAISTASALREYESYMYLIGILEEGALPGNLLNKTDRGLQAFAAVNALNLLQALIKGNYGNPFILTYTVGLIEKTARKASDDVRNIASNTQQNGEGSPINEDNFQRPRLNLESMTQIFQSVLEGLNATLPKVKNGEAANQIQQAIQVIEGLDQQLIASVGIPTEEG